MIEQLKSLRDLLQSCRRLVHDEFITDEQVAALEEVISKLEGDSSVHT